MIQEGTGDPVDLGKVDFGSSPDLAIVGEKNDHVSLAWQELYLDKLGYFGTRPTKFSGLEPGRCSTYAVRRILFPACLGSSPPIWTAKLDISPSPYPDRHCKSNSFNVLLWTALSYCRTHASPTA